MPAPFLQLKKINSAIEPVDTGLDITITLNGVDRTYTIGPFADNDPFTLDPDGKVGGFGGVAFSGPGFLVRLADELNADATVVQNYQVTLSDVNVLNIRALQDDPAFNFTNVSGTLINNPNPGGTNKLNVEIQIDATGTNTGSGVTPQTAAPRVNLTAFTLPNIYPSITQSYCLGNLSDLQEIVIEFTIPQTITANQGFAFYYNFLEKEVELYPNNTERNPDFTLDADTYFRNRVTNDVQVFKGGVGTLSADQGAKSFVTGDITISDLGIVPNGNKYRITQNVRLTDFVLLENRIGNTFTYDTKYPKYVFRIDITDVINPDNIIFTTNSINLSEYILDGSLGYFGEVLNTGKENYVKNDGLSSIPQINIAQDTSFTVVIDSNNGNITGATQVFLKSQKIVSTDFEGTKTFLENIEFSEVSFLAGGGATNSIFTNVTSSFSGTQLTINFDIAAGSIDESYALWATVSNNNSTVNHNNVLIDINDPDTAADESVIDTSNNPDTNRNNCSFLYHFQPQSESLSNGFDVLNPFIEDRVVAIRTIENNDNVNTRVSSIVLQIRRTSNGQIIEGENFTIRDPNQFIQSRNYNVLESDIRANITVNKRVLGNTDFFDIVYPFQIWQRYLDSDGLGYDDIVFDVTMNCVQTINTGEEISFVKTFRSTVFGQGNAIGSYDLTQNTPSQPQIELREIRFGVEGSLSLDSDGLIINPFPRLVKGQNNRVQFIFEDNNLNDIIFNENVLVGYLGIGTNNDINKYYQFHSVDSIGVSSNNPWFPITGETDNVATITKIDTKTCMIEAVLSWGILRSVVGVLNVYQISARIDRKDPPVNFTIDLTIEE